MNATSWTSHLETHRSDRIGWLRAAVLGANDGLLSVASMVVGVASASADHQTILLTGVAGLTAGAMSMAAGEYVSVSSQADTESADRVREERELRETPESELAELTDIYLARGLNERLAREVAVALTQHDALSTHMRDELGITEQITARPLQAAIASAVSFACGAALPLLVAIASPSNWIFATVAASTVIGLASLGGLSAWVGGAPLIRAAMRVAFWGIVAMAVTSFFGWLFGVSVA